MEAWQETLAICMMVAGITVLAVARVAYMIGKSNGYITGRNVNLRQEIKVFLEGQTPMTAELYDAASLGNWDGPMPGTVWGFTHLQAKLSGEAGEFAEHFGKALRDDPGTLGDFHNGFVKFTPERRKAMLKELGDILWYVTVLAKELGSSLLEVMVLNVTKLQDRKKRNVMGGAGDNR